MKLIKDPVHGYIPLSDGEARIIDTYAFQRLRRISQLPLVHLVYPGARHSRFDHSIGSLFLAGEFAAHLNLDEFDSELLRVSALLHDIGHTPYSHLLESILMESEMDHEDKSAEIIKNDSELADSIESSGLNIRDVIDVLSGRNRLSKLVSGPLDVDRLDFLVRDAYFTGATYGIIDVRRIIHLTRLDEEGPSVDVRGLGAVEELAMARHHSFMNIYFHHAVRAAQVLFLRGVEELRGEGLDFAKMSTEEYLSHDDFTVWCLMKSNPKTRWVIDNIERRRLPKKIYEAKGEGGVQISEALRARRELEEEISSSSGVDASKIYVDSSHEPPLAKFGASEIRIHSSETGRLITPDSWILEMTSKPIHIVRVYVDRGVNEIESVRRAAERLIPRSP